MWLARLREAKPASVSLHLAITLRFPSRFAQPSHDDLFASSPFPSSPSYATHPHDLDLEDFYVVTARQQHLEQERRRRPHAAALADERHRCQQQAAFERAVNKEVERRLQLEQAVKEHLAAVHRAQAEEEQRRRQVALASAKVAQRRAAIVAAHQEQARRRAAAVEQERRRRIVVARRQRQIVEPSSGNFVQFLLDLGSGEVDAPSHSSALALIPTAVSPPSRPSPSSFINLLRALGRQEEVAASAPHAPAERSSANSLQPSSAAPSSAADFFNTLLQSAFAAANAEEDDSEPSQEHPQVADPPTLVVDPSATPAVDSPVPPSTTSPLPAPSPADVAALEDAATTLQRRYRRHTARRDALAALSAITADFASRQSSFTAPSSLVFRPSSPPSSDGLHPATPPLAFSSSNTSFLAHEDFLVQLLSKIDEIQSGGDRVVKTARKELVKKIEGELEKLDGLKEREWEQQSAASKVEEEKLESVEPVVEGPSSAVETTASPTRVADVVVPASEPAKSTPAATTPSSSDGSPASAVDVSTSPAPLDAPSTTTVAVEATRTPSSSLPPDTVPSSSSALTSAAVAALPPVTSSRIRRTASRASTASISSDESGAFDEYVAKVQNAAEALGERVRRSEEEQRVEKEQKGEKEEKDDEASEAGTEDFEVV